MADPLSIAAGAAGFVSLGLQTVSTIYNFIETYKDQDKNTARILKRVRDLRTVYGALETAIEESNKKFTSIVESSLQSCYEKVKALELECQKFTQPTSALARLSRKTTYSFGKKSLDRLEAEITTIQADLALALSSLIIQGQQTIRNEVKNNTFLLGGIYKEHTLNEIRQWLQIPTHDAAAGHRTEFCKQSSRTGSWLLESSQFKRWQAGSDPFMWLKGPPGCGKTVLCSAVIECIIRLLDSKPNTGSSAEPSQGEYEKATFGLAYFYFSHLQEPFKEDGLIMLCCLAFQLAQRSTKAALHLVSAYEKMKLNRLSSSQVQEILENQIQHFDCVYLIVDAVDESSYGEIRTRVLDVLDTLRRWPRVRMFVSSRDEIDISERIGSEVKTSIYISEDLISKDIATYIFEQMRENRILKRTWHLYEQEITDHLIAHAHGSFRWVERQLKALEECPPTRSDLHNCLQVSADSLDEMYQRDLFNIKRGATSRVRRLLTIICAAKRPLTVREVLDALTINLEEPSCVDDGARIGSKEELLSLCPSLIEFYDLEPEEYQKFIVELRGLKNSGETFVRLRHKSLQSYLFSAHCQRGGARRFALDAVTADQELGGICLAFLLSQRFVDFVLSHWGSYNLTAQFFPFAFYASSMWCHHLAKAGRISNVCKDMVHKLFQDEDGDCFFAWKCILWRAWNQDHRRATAQTQLASSSQFGRDYVVIEALVGFPPEYERYSSAPKFVYLGKMSGDLIRDYDNIGQAAAKLDHVEVIKIFYERGSDINLLDGKYNTILQAAVNSHEIFEFCLAKGANVNIREGDSETALQAASGLLRANPFNTLLDMKADVNAVSATTSGTALQRVAISNYIDRAMELLERGAEVNLVGGNYGTALIAAVDYDKPEMIEFLLNNKADVNIVAGDHGTALQCAAAAGREHTVAMLIEKGADVNALGGKAGSALQAAVINRRVNIVRILLRSGANPNLSAGQYRNPLEAAKSLGKRVAGNESKEQIVQLLIKAGAIT